MVGAPARRGFRNRNRRNKDEVWQGACPVYIPAKVTTLRIFSGGRVQKRTNSGETFLISP
jgi:hypothetical protein